MFMQIAGKINQPRRRQNRLSLLTMCKRWQFALMLALLPALSVAEDLTGIFASGKAPYLWAEDSDIRGAELDIVGAVLRRAGFEVQARAMSNNRLLATFAGSDADFAAGLQPADLPLYCHTAIYMSYHNVAITKRSRHIALDSIAGLLGHKVAIRQYLYQDLGLDRGRGGMPASLPGDFTEFTSQDQQVRFFFADRADVIILDRTIFEWYAKRLGLLKSRDAIEIHDLFPERHGVRAVFKDERKCAQFDRDLAAIVADGTYRSIWKSYDVEGTADPLR